ncbi:late competence development ComFB family protein [Clostridium sp. CX1]|uniref:Late competence development ComFB family protein n=1 Tax=Clostridium tanneri TaxID=3037988 RepID=A0ABU4JTA8_9CLOT|nr:MULTISPECIES: late competence development ComFB family protein [unclassified Clostridium]MCT8975372.1 late competence development ComFB family protein [Clostridium sp. CX1]MDW8801397.1 late competence development ComFB family protein [Clostridium sp. A1-XYC3]
MITNYMEIVVDNLLPSILEGFEDVCRCERCLDDIRAIALNNLKPLYVVSDKGILYTKVNELKMQFNTDVIQELVKSIQIVSKNPRHTD